MKEDILFQSMKSYGVNSSSRCCYSLISSALARGINVRIYSLDDIMTLCRESNIPYKKHYHRVGQIFSLEYEQIYVLNKTKFFTSKLPSAFSKTSLKEGVCPGFDSPKGIVFKKNNFSPELLKKKNISFPVVLKPVNGSMGEGVCLDIGSVKELYQKINESNPGDLIVEEQIQGDEYRIYLIEGKYYGAVKRVPAHVVGDGKSTVRELIVKKNKLKRDKYLPLIQEDKALEFLSTKKLQANYIPEKGVMLPLTSVLGRSSGGDVYDVSASLPKWIQYKLNELSVYFQESLCVGLDIIASDKKLYIIEANGRPQLSSLLVPDRGKGKNIGDALVQSLFPNAPLLHKMGKGMDNIKKGISLARKYNKSILLEAEKFDFHSTLNDINDKRYHNYNVPVHINRLMLFREASARELRRHGWTNEKGNQRWSLSSAQRSIIFRENMPSNTSHQTRTLTNSKEKTKNRLLEHGVQVPVGIRIKAKDTAQASNWFDSLGDFPRIVVKPLAGASGKGVTSNITTQSAMFTALALANLEHEQAVLEEHIPGFDYRLFVVNGKFKYAIKRHPAHIVGDGLSTVEDLIKQKNKLRNNNPYSGKYPLTLDNATLARIQRKGYDAISVLSFGEMLYLQDIANIGAGGDSEDVTDRVHSDFVEIAERTYSSFDDLAFCGLDLLTEDISQPASSQRYAVIEVNVNCDLAMHHFPTRGQSRNAAGAILDALFPESEVVPAVSRELHITGKVQKVNYRKWFAKQAVIRAIKGEIRNCQDGSVHAIVQGSPSAIEDLVKVASKGPIKADVKKIEITEQVKKDSFSNFSIVR
ncbi:acylphosphatase [Carnimonas nigrificans]|uniref:acylphosphatase n=1 Tax=Carnimonas nigrificans TaxID=64323 RepID=UPI0004B443B6|nr:acylphosphatase [Carnimonas nigrificans]